MASAAAKIIYERFIEIYVQQSFWYSSQLSSFTTISGGSGFIHNINPSISYYSSGGSRYPIVSWTGRDDESQTSCTVIRPKSSIVWGSVFITGTSVNNTVNQSVTNSDNTVIAWSENNGSSSKYAKRINAQYSCVGKVLSDSSTDVSLSGGNSLSQIKALIFKGTGTAPYLINKSTKDFSLFTRDLFTIQEFLIQQILNCHLYPELLIILLYLFYHQQFSQIH